MVKVIRLPEIVNKDLASISAELASVAKKPISPAMTVSMLIAVYRAHLREPCARDALMQKIATSELMTPDEFEKVWDVPPSKTRKIKNKEARKKNLKSL